VKLVTELSQTIAAIASAPGHAERGLIRISGNDVMIVLSQLFEFAETPDPKIAQRYQGRVLFERDLAVEASTYLWPTERSYTGQPMAELHLPGSPALLEMVLEAVFKHGARPAERGEFTLRSFLAGRIDLPQAEAVLGVIDAFDHQELNVALRQLAGGLSGQITDIRTALIEVLADLEAGLDFVEEDIEFIELPELLRQLAACRDRVSELYEQAAERMRSTGRLKVVLAGFPNAGKSTLFNRLVGARDALVSNEVGTTRDYLSSDVSIDGLAIELIDTAGWEQATSPIGELAQVFRSEQVAEADLIVWCSAWDCPVNQRASEQACLEQLGLTKRDRSDPLDVFEESSTGSAFSHRPVLVVNTKSDLHGSDSNRDQVTQAALPASVSISADRGDGLDELSLAISEQLSNSKTGDRQLVGSTASRSRDSLRRALDALERSIAAAELRIGDELLAVEIRESLEHLGEIVGAVYTDDVLDRVFSRFCIGK
jgi:tRNA modification GTPase